MVLEGQPGIGAEGAEEPTPLEQEYAALSDEERAFVDGLRTWYENVIKKAVPDMADEMLPTLDVLVKGVAIDSLKHHKGEEDVGSVLSGDDFT